MSRILATNGKHTRLMGRVELRQNPDYWPVNEENRKPQQPSAPASVPAPGTPVKTSTKEVRSPEPAAADPVVPVKSAEPAERHPIPVAIAKVKATTTIAELDAVISGEYRATVLSVADKHRKRIAKQ